MNSGTLGEQAVALHRSGRLAEAEDLYRQVLAGDPHDFTARHLLGVVRAQQGCNEDALVEIGAALALRPEDAEALLNRANVLRSLGRLDAALDDLDRALAARPGWPQALNNRGTVLKAMGRFDQALASYDRALAAAPTYAEALNNRGSVLQDLRRPAEALASYDQALNIAPGFAAAFNNRGAALLELKRFAEALSCFDRAAALRPEDAEILNNRGNALQGLSRHDAAVASYDRALALRPGYAEALNNRGGALLQLRREEDALTSYEQALALPGGHHAFAGAALAALCLNDWPRVAAFGAQLAQHVANGQALAPLTVLGYSGDEHLQRQAAHNAIAARFPSLPPPLATGPYGHDRIRLAYISSDFRNHAVAAQLVELIALHDRGRFTVTGFSTGPDDASPLRRRIVQAFDHFHDVHGQAPGDVARLIRDAEVDVLVDLNGHTENDNFDILSMRAAPVQATWLGYAGTSAAPFLDYVIADKVVAPDAAAFSEGLALLPGSFFPRDTTRVPRIAPTRADAALPQDAIVFCCFNNNRKITAPVFALWMRLLAGLPDSVLWLKQAGAAATANLRRSAQGHGIDPARLVFAPPAAPDVHLARHALADLFLDTLPYNAHATASDALWAGLPVLTCRGTAAAGRVAASLLTAAGLPELIAESAQDYEALALALARDPARLAALKQRLADARATAPLFDMPRLTRDLEALYLGMRTPRPDDTAGLFAHAGALADVGRTPEALAVYDAVLAAEPGHAAALNNRGNALRSLMRFDDALASFDAALAVEPANAPARYNRGETLMALDRPEPAFADFTAASRIFHAQSVHDRLRPHKIDHDAEQKAYLAEQGIAVRDGVLHLEGGERLDTAAINTAGAAGVTARWTSRNPQMVVVDDLLTPEALTALRRFCWGSTVWRKAHAQGYLGAFPENGFAPPLLAQIAQELRAAYPAIFAGHPLLYAWAFKYGAALRGTEIHADEAAINVNFWITPDDANLDPGHGGLVVWDKAAPLHWAFAQFNNDAELARRFLAESGAKPITVPYRCNRAVIFDSDLFHETDAIHFRDGYRNRRINVTLLYGRRAS